VKICWDNLNKLRYSLKTHKWYTRIKTPYILKICQICNEEFLGKNRNIYCSKSCSVSSWRKGKKLSEEQKKKLSDSHKGKKLTKEHKENISRALSKNLKFNIKQKYCKNDIPVYDTYASQLSWIEDVRRNKEDLNILETKCIYCGRWFIPKLNSVNNRIQVLKGQFTGEYNFYCSNGCKKACPIYLKKPETLMKEDAVRAGRLNWLELNREVQPQLRQLVLLRDNYECVRCEKIEELHCHHILPVATDPLLSADIDNCITLCIECHKKVHNQDGCTYGELRECI